MTHWSSDLMRRTEIAALLLALCLLTGCAVPATSAEETAEPNGAEEPLEAATSAVADASQMTTVEDVVEDGMVPIPASELVDGVYEAAVKSSSSMFRIEHCELTVADGAMTARLTMSSDSYGYLFAGTAEEAAAADAARYIEPDGTAFVLPIEALDEGVPCAAWSRKKELWYDRTLVFRADSLPFEAFRSLVTADSLGLADGTYTADVTLTGGSGRAGVQSPARLTVADGGVLAELIWSSGNYDYMLVGGERYDAEVIDGHSTFLVPVTAFDHPLSVVADTTAMSQPYEIDYTLRFDASSIKASGAAE